MLPALNACTPPDKQTLVCFDDNILETTKHCICFCHFHGLERLIRTASPCSGTGHILAVMVDCHSHCGMLQLLHCKHWCMLLLLLLLLCRTTSGLLRTATAPIYQQVLPGTSPLR